MRTPPTKLFQFISSDVTASAIIDVLRPLHALTVNKHFTRNNAVGNVYVTHYKTVMLASLKIKNQMYQLSDIEIAILNIFYTQAQ